MKKWQKVSTAIALGATLVGLAGCGSGDAKAEDSKVPTILMYEQGAKPKEFDKLLSKVNQVMEKEAGAKLDIQFIDFGDYSKKMSVIVSSGESYDIAMADNYVVNAQKGAYADLTELAPKYAKEAFDMIDQAYIDGNTVDGKLYAFPVNNNVYSQQVLSFDKELLDKYDLSIENVKDYKDLEPLFKVIKENEPNLALITTGPNYKVYEDLDHVINNNLPFVVRTTGDDKETIYNKYDLPEVQEDLQTMHDFYQKGYIIKDAATSTTTYPLGEKTWFSRASTQGPFDYGNTALSNAAGREIVTVPLTSKIKSVSDLRMANFVISSTSKHKEEALKILNVLNTNTEVLNTLVYGLEGEAWEYNDNDTVTLLDGYKPDYHLSTWNVGNGLTATPTDGITQEQIDERDKNISEAPESPIVGCNFSFDDVKTEITNVSSVINKYQVGLMTGTLDPDETIPKMNKELEAAGMNKIIKELQSQYDEFLSEK
ncbi:ABC transporter substrate-binding protein [Enterococcus diestrammenae]|uniref:ABC transporter substrate-binding protein n=1 Tax=Enterococcus diestrammenae TaxID=1155073 RepID=UPI00195ADF8B